MLKIMFIRLSIHSSYQYFFSTYKMLGSKWGTGETAINNQRWPTANITQVTLFTIVVNITKERYRVPSGTGKSVGSKEGWWRGKRMLSWGKDLRAETRVGGAAQGKWERKQSGVGTAGLQAPGGKELGQSVCGGEEPREAGGVNPSSGQNLRATQSHWTPSFYAWRHSPKSEVTSPRTQTERYWQNFLFMTLGPVGFLLVCFVFSIRATSTL